MAREFSRTLVRRMSSYVNEKILAQQKEHKSNEVNKMRKGLDKGPIDWVERILGPQHGKTSKVYMCSLFRFMHALRNDKECAAQIKKISKM